MRRTMAGALAVGLVALGAAVATAAVPLMVPVQGVVRDNSGSLVADGAFEVVFALYASDSGGEALWTETWPPGGGDCQASPADCVGVAGGVFDVALGTHEALSTELLVAAGSLWLGLAIEGEPELDRRRLGSSPYALVAGTATALDCTGCLPASALSDDARQQLLDDAVAAVEAAGVGGAIDEGDLPPNGLDEVSGGLLTTQFVHHIASPSTPTPILDNNPEDYLTNVMVVPDLGIAESMSIFLSLTNSEIGGLTITVTAPNGNEYLLHDSGPSGTTIDTTYPLPTALLAGDVVGDWIGQNPAGAWSLTVIDTDYENNGFDGEVVDWGVEFQVISNTTVGVQGDLDVDGDLDLKNHHIVNSRFQLASGPPVVCSGATTGFFYWDTDDSSLRVCAGGEFRKIRAILCGDGITEDGESCDDGGTTPGDGCSATCTVENGWTCVGAPASTCATTCGDGIVAGQEACDNFFPGEDDGCADNCQVVNGFYCTGSPSICDTQCGDEITAGEESCDDGNEVPGDGCDACVSECEVSSSSQTFAFTGSTVAFTVPECIESITIQAFGGQGGKNNPCVQQGGRGARMTGTFAVSPGEQLMVLAAGRGLDRGSDEANQSGTGGGGSFVWRSGTNELLIAAGGGGGGAICTSGGSPAFATGRDGVTAECGTADTTNAQQGGCGGADGGGDARGKGWNSVQSNPAGYGSGGDQGGYGGGGTIGSSHGGGGGGGYSGGGGHVYTGNPAPAGGGGGSFNSGTSQDNAPGVQTGPGQVIISW